MRCPDTITMKIIPEPRQSRGILRMCDIVVHRKLECIYFFLGPTETLILQALLFLPPQNKNIDIRGGGWFHPQRLVDSSYHALTLAIDLCQFQAFCTCEERRQELPQQEYLSVESLEKVEGGGGGGGNPAKLLLMPPFLY